MSRSDHSFYRLGWIAKRRCAHERAARTEEVGGSKGPEIKRLNCRFDLQEKLQVERCKLDIVTASSQNGCYTCQTNPVQICAGFSL